MEFFSNRTGYYYCNTTFQSYVYNLTSSYTDQKNEATMVATSMVMLFLAALFFALNLFSRFSDVSAFLKPSIRLFLYVSLSLFLPVMSYLFSEAKNHDITAGGGDVTELPLRARTILLWMLLVELLYKKVEAIFWATADVHGYAGTVERAARIVWLGYLVFYNLRSAGKKAFYGVLWLLAASKLVQRFVTSELGKRSFAYGRNPQLLASYMAQVVARPQQEEGGSSSSGLLKRCEYAVMGEENLEKMARSMGYYHLNLKEVMVIANKADSSAVFVTVGKVWEISESDPLLRKDPGLKRLCLSFALYKLLRRAVEGFPITPAEARDCHRLIFKGLWQEENEQGTGTATDRHEANADALFQVLNDEVQFLCEYYHSVHPVMYASPFFFLVNYIMFPIVVWAACVLMTLLCNNGDVGYALRSFRADNFPTSVGIVRMTVCLLSKVNNSPPDLFSTVDLSISVLLFLTFAYEQVWEFIVFLLSNWFMVSLLSTYTSKPQRRRDSPLFRGLIRRILWVRSCLSHPNVCFKQFSVLWFCRVSPSSLPTLAVPRQVKHAIIQHLATAQHDGGVALALPGMSSSPSTSRQHDIDEHLSSAAYGDDGVATRLAEVILTWHIATGLLESTFPPPRQQTPAPGAVAVPLSRYCAYLVAFQPGLLPDDKDATEHVYGKMKDELKEELGCWRYYLARQGTRCQKLKEMAARRPDHRPGAAKTTMTVLCRGARLGQLLIEKATGENGPGPMWKLLDDVWTEIVVYAAPTSSELHVKAHKEALAQGGEFITMLWALATHTGLHTSPDSADFACIDTRLALIS